jgi:hypothetical protein
VGGTGGAGRGGLGLNVVNIDAFGDRVTSTDPTTPFRRYSLSDVSVVLVAGYVFEKQASSR